MSPVILRNALKGEDVQGSRMPQRSPMRYHTKSESSSDRGMTLVGLHPDPEVRHFEIGVT